MAEESKDQKADNRVAPSPPTGRGPSTGPSINRRGELVEPSGRGSGRGIAGVLDAILKSLATVLVITLLGLQVVELGLILERISVLESRQPPAREEAVSIPAPAASPTPLTRGESKPAGLKVELTRVKADDDGLNLSLEVHQSGPAALFFEQPTLEGKQTYEIDPDSLEEARLGMLDVVTRGRAEIELRFTPVPDEGEDLTLVFNPRHSQDDPVAPRIEVPVEH